MRYAEIIENDVVNGENICVSLFVQGCHRKCKNCFNPETWNFEGGIEEDVKILTLKIMNLIQKNGIQRNLSILGGEPLCLENRMQVNFIVKHIKERFPNIKIFLWTGYTIKELIEENDLYIQEILKTINCLIDGPFIEEEKDITLKWRGSRNQRILTKKEINDIINLNKIKGRI